jgi:hypothetical protein
MKNPDIYDLFFFPRSSAVNEFEKTKPILGKGKSKKVKGKMRTI